MRSIFKTTIISIFFLLFVGSDLFAQKFEITPFYGYMLAGKVPVYSGDLNIRDGGTYGIMLDIQIQPGMQVELYYSRLDTRVDLISYPARITTQLTDMSVNYFQLGVLRELKKINKIVLTLAPQVTVTQRTALL